MFTKTYPELPEFALIFDIEQGYMLPDDIKYFFKRINKYFGKATSLRSFTVFQSGFKEISFWIMMDKVGTRFQRLICWIFKDKIGNYADRLADELNEEFKENLGLEILVSIRAVNRRDNE